MGGLNLVGELYDYMIGIVIVGVIFTSAVFIVPAISYVNLLQVNQQQLRNTALNVFNAILLGTGSPPEWGSTFPFDQNNVEAFGLDLSKKSSLYIMDTDKLQRLDKDSPGYIEYPYVRDLLRLEEYGFCLSIFRPFTVDWDLQINNTPNYVWFAVNVTRSEDRRPIPNAQVSVTILCSAKNPDKVDEPIVNVTQPDTLFTDSLGRCEGTQPIQIPTGYIIETAVAIMKITVAGISTMVVAQQDQTVQNVMKINTFGDTIILSFRGELTNTSAVRRVLNIMSFNYDETLTEIYGGGDGNEDKITEGYGYVFWNSTFPGLKAMDPALLLFLVSVPLGAGGGGRRPVMVAGPFSLWESSEIFSFGADSEQVRDAAIKLRRYVVVSGITYIAELTLWKE
jgi:type II secretory pathway pseudopilin PulG